METKLRECTLIWKSQFLEKPITTQQSQQKKKWFSKFQRRYSTFFQTLVGAFLVRTPRGQTISQF